VSRVTRSGQGLSRGHSVGLVALACGMGGLAALAFLTESTVALVGIAVTWFLIAIGWVVWPLVRRTRGER
jgi:hypothetical protein